MLSAREILSFISRLQQMDEGERAVIFTFWNVYARKTTTHYVDRLANGFHFRSSIGCLEPQKEHPWPAANIPWPIYRFATIHDVTRMPYGYGQNDIVFVPPGLKIEYVTAWVSK